MSRCDHCKYCPYCSTGIERLREDASKWQTQSCKQSLLTDQQAAEIERLREAATHCIACGSTEVRAVDQVKEQADEIERLREDVEACSRRNEIDHETIARLREALEAIITHQELGGGGLTVISTITHIARKALEADDE